MRCRNDVEQNLETLRRQLWCNLLEAITADEKFGVERRAMELRAQSRARLGDVDEVP